MESTRSKLPWSAVAQLGARARLSCPAGNNQYGYCTKQIGYWARPCHRHPGWPYCHSNPSALKAILCLIMLVSVGAIKPSDTIQWSTHRSLQWSDYQGNSQEFSEHAALTYYSVRSNSTFLDRRHLSHEVTCVFVKSRSWVRPEHSADTTLLNHERQHFNLAECNARALRSALLRITSFDASTRKVPSVRDSVNTAWNRIQELYDKETSHGTIANEQTRWAKKIAHTLDSLAAYSEPRFVVDLKP